VTAREANRPVALVTGGNRGIGAAIVERLVADSCMVASVSRSAQEDADGAVIGLAADVNSSSQMVRACEVVVHRFGHLDLVIANAGLAHQGRLTDHDSAEWRGILETNIAGVWNTVQAALPHLVRGRDPQVVVLGSVAGIGQHAGEPVYLTSKWAVRGMALALRRELREAGVRVALVEPGLTLTEMTQSAPQAAEWLRAVDPLLPGDVADLVSAVVRLPARAAVGEIVVRPALQVV
jgi:NADP-dependent 3-hydroxy acid dehydrogenase YdfG